VDLGKLGTISLPGVLYSDHTSDKKWKGVFYSWLLYQFVADAGWGRYPRYYSAVACKLFTWVTNSSDQRQPRRFQGLWKDACKIGLGFHHGLNYVYHDLLAHLLNSWESSRMKKVMKEVIIKSRDGSSSKMGAKGLLECLVGKK